MRPVNVRHMKALEEIYVSAYRPVAKRCRSINCYKMSAIQIVVAPVPMYQRRVCFLGDVSQSKIS